MHFCKYGFILKIIYILVICGLDWFVFMESFKLHLYLNRLFSPRQTEILLKKYKGEPLNKTEQEYYSRIVKKKLEAVCDIEVRKIAESLTGEKV